jgi:hypothetical protein
LGLIFISGKFWNLTAFCSNIILLLVLDYLIKRSSTSDYFFFSRGDRRIYMSARNLCLMRNYIFFNQIVTTPKYAAHHLQRFLAKNRYK